MEIASAMSGTLPPQLDRQHNVRVEGCLLRESAWISRLSGLLKGIKCCI